jgi:hypothetical protein
MGRARAKSNICPYTVHSGNKIPTIQFTPLEIIYNKIRPSIKPGLRIRIRIRIQLDSDPEGQKIYFMFLSAGCSLLRAEGIFCTLDVLYGDLGIGKL